VLLRNSIVAYNVSRTAAAPSECSGSILSQNYNVIGARSTCSLTGNTAHVNATDAALVLLAPNANGGFANDQVSYWGATIPLASCTDAICAPLGVDGRGYSRGSTGLCEIGALEFDGRHAPASPIGVELLRNGGAAGNELGLAAVDTSAADPPYWARDFDGMTQAVYGSPNFPLRSDAPAGSGSYFFRAARRASRSPSS
jgi:hypothetical protein